MLYVISVLSYVWYEGKTSQKDQNNQCIWNGKQKYKVKRSSSELFSLCAKCATEESYQLHAFLSCDNGNQSFYNGKHSRFLSWIFSLSYSVDSGSRQVLYVP
jgi:hypothetical protein